MANSTDRRNFFTEAIFSLWGLITAAVSLPAAAYLLIVPKPRRPDDFIEVADLKQLKEKDPEEIIFRRNRRDGWKVTSEKSSAWIVKTADDKAIAFVPSCTHLGCAFHWDERNNNFLCPCHTSTFTLEGQPIAGPATRPLDRYDVEVRDGKLFVGGLHKRG
ncbi:MAG: ubiquinol-cytochrome c reductase iron-sulfur subunit [Bryobacteraceae bacterium]|jgi:menaquinol-cytochrome c reductase iron-sulfur subunit|nr:ubiquinol-cytochrome c reductase iron-sulfur subunit [Bryobacteraceae bacterium]